LCSSRSARRLTTASRPLLLDKPYDVVLLGDDVDAEGGREMETCLSGLLLLADDPPTPYLFGDAVAVLPRCPTGGDSRPEAPRRALATAAAADARTADVVVAELVLPPPPPSLMASWTARSFS